MGVDGQVTHGFACSDREPRTPDGRPDCESRRTPFTSSACVLPGRECCDQLKDAPKTQRRKPATPDGSGPAVELHAVLDRRSTGTRNEKSVESESSADVRCFDWRRYSGR